MAPLYEIFTAQVDLDGESVGDLPLSARRIKDGKHLIQHGDTSVPVRIAGNRVAIEIPEARGNPRLIDIPGFGEDVSLADIIQRGWQRIEIIPPEGQSAITIFGGEQIGSLSLENHSRRPSTCRIPGFHPRK